MELTGVDRAIDQALEALYDSDRSGGLGSSAPSVARWLGDITYFPKSVVRVMQRDALERLNLRQMLLEPGLLEAVEADMHLVSTLLSLKSVLPGKTKEPARIVVRRVVEDLERRLARLRGRRSGQPESRRTQSPPAVFGDGLAPHHPR